MMVGTGGFGACSVGGVANRTCFFGLAAFTTLRDGLARLGGGGGYLDINVSRSRSNKDTSMARATSGSSFEVRKHDTLPQYITY
jgi:5-formyltetrahydrofolate cyclo-ligase